MSDKPLTDKQRKIFEFICAEIEKRGFPPSIREIGKKFDITSPNGVVCHLKALEKKKMLKREGNCARAIVVDRVRQSTASIPLLGLVAAGTGIEAVAVNERLNFGELFAGSNHYALKVRGKSMIEDHIDDGDYVIIRKQATADNGQRVVAMINDEVTLKKFHKKRNEITLEPSNSRMKPIVVTKDKDIHILGVLMGVVRKCK